MLLRIGRDSNGMFYSSNMNRLDYKKVKSLYNSGLSQRDIANWFGVSQRSVLRFFQKNNIESRSINYNYVSEIKRLKGISSFKFNDYNFGYFYGVLLGDGTIGQKRIALHVKDYDFIDKFRKVSEYLELNCSKITVDKKGHKMICIHNRELAYFFRKMKLTKGHNLNLLFDDAVIGFINGFIDSEGYVAKERKRIVVVNINKNIINFVSAELSKRNVINKVLKSDYLYKIYISSVNVNNFNRLFKFSIKRKQLRLEHICQKRKA